ncbi:pseudouridine synthase [Rickettsia endosymbiont of Cardiosporidium cionae]|uniref:pseudouridine synthase n=1 Tax=Rickettsia endosymbiont of Cardiosporidium cionae TaxID=2777155 RepID=UPI0018945D72|nr:pseudouridine synthase [Rickettsia endosymbiont of Cardiosporidium cionae]KAF8818819.1 rRNA pseudouridine synthase [Rickettsia endosymbiont of Cardiosporidium cionae]
MEQRIAKYISSSGVCSRRMAEKLIQQGRVKLDEAIVTTPAINVNPDHKIYVDDKLVIPTLKTRVWIYYKPVGLITTHRDPLNRPTVFSSLKSLLPRVISVGRLDMYSEGLLLLTNNGSFARNMELPKNKVKRIYKVRAYGDTNLLLNATRKEIFESLHYDISSLYLLSPQHDSINWFKITLTEGKNREIRNIFQYFRLTVTKLIRIQYGKYQLSNLCPTEFKEVSI